MAVQVRDEVPLFPDAEPIDRGLTSIWVGGKGDALMQVAPDPVP